MLRIADLKKRLLTGAAVYISDDFVDVAEASLTAKGMHVPSLRRFPLQRSIKGLPFADAKESVGKIINEAFEKGKKASYRIAVNLRDDSFILRRFKLREIPENELDKAIVFEAQRYVPYNVDNLIFRYKKGVKRKGLQEIIFVGSEKENIDAIIDFFREREILPSVIEPAPFLLTRMMNLEKGIEKEKAYLVLHYEPSNKIAITGIWQKRPYFFKDMAISPVEPEHKLGHEEVYPLGEEPEKTPPSEPPPGENPSGEKPPEEEPPKEKPPEKEPEPIKLAYPSLKEVWDRIERDILNSVEYLRKETKKEVDKIFISGFSSDRKEEANISKNFGITVKRLTLSQFSNVNIEDKDRFIPALSLIYDMFHSPFLNLTRKEITYRDPWAFRPVLVKSALAVCAVIILHIFLTSFNLLQEKKVNRLRENLGAYNVIRPEATKEEALGYEDAMKGKIVFIDKILSNRLYLAEKMDRLSKDIPKNAWVNSMDFRNPVGDKEMSQLKLRCELYTPDGRETADVNDIIERFESDKTMMSGFEKIKLIYTRKGRPVDGKEITEFEILLK
ncbi:MAG: pilus assembly protein PilM [Candidatus Omnitrophica bacterium]|nr:pilus assembly protein PilM [Candidatus Omnitrophota bacterium]